MSCGAPAATGVTFNNTGGSFTCTYPDGDASQTLQAGATDSDGGTSAFDSQVVTINNVAPTIAISGAASVTEGLVLQPDAGRSDRSWDRHCQRLHRALG